MTDRSTFGIAGAEKDRYNDPVPTRTPLAQAWPPDDKPFSTSNSMKKPLQLSFDGIFAEAEIERQTAHLPSTIEDAVPVYSELIERHHAALMAGDIDGALRLNKEAHIMAVRLNGGEPGILADADSPGHALERRTAAPFGSVPLWGQKGTFMIEVAGVRVRIEIDGIFGIASRPVPGFSIHVVDYDRPFISETGFRSFLGLNSIPAPGTTPDAYVFNILGEYIRRDMKGKLRSIEPRYKPGTPEPH